MLQKISFKEADFNEFTRFLKAYEIKEVIFDTCEFNELKHLELEVTLSFSSCAGDSLMKLQEANKDKVIIWSWKQIQTVSSRI